ncbi:MAG: 1,4-dihydroxy-2-naphthoate octaprenyltransferase [Dehalococcoidia bacterium]
MESLRLWWAASRPVSFTASVVPVLVGTLIAADGSFSWWKGLLALIGSVAIHAGTNFVNDYYDHVKGADNETSLGPAGFIQRGLLKPKAVLWAGILTFAAGAGVGLVLCSVTSWELLWLGMASVVAGFLYTGAPIHLAYIGLGEVTVFIFMGPVIVLGAYFVQVESWDWQPIAASVPIGFLVTAILQANNLRDIDNDRATGKRTVATMVGRTWANREMYGLLAGAYVALVVAVAIDALPLAALVALVTAPLVRPIVKIIVAGGNPRKLNFALMHTAGLHMQFGIVLSLGLAMNWLVVSVR